MLAREVIVSSYVRRFLVNLLHLVVDTSTSHRIVYFSCCRRIAYSKIINLINKIVHLSWTLLIEACWPNTLFMPMNYEHSLQIVRAIDFSSALGARSRPRVNRSVC